MHAESLLAPAPPALSSPHPDATDAAPRVDRPAGFRRGLALLDGFCKRPVLIMFGLLLAVLAAYLPALNAQFLWDDKELVLKNFLIRSPLFCAEVFRHTLFGGLSNFFRPTQTLLFIADYWVWGFEPFGYHLTSILIHGADGFLLFLLLRRLLPVLCAAWSRGELSAPSPSTDVPAFAVAALWALHPMHSAAVAYVSGSADSLAMLWCVSAWLLAERAQTATCGWGTLAFGVGSGACLLLGLCSKEIAFVWLAIFACYRLFFFPSRHGGRRFDWAALGGSLAIFGVYVALRHRVSVPAAHNSLPTHSALGMALRALGDYGSLLVFPGRLLMERQVYPAPGAVLTAEDQLFYASLTAGGVLLLLVLALGFCWSGPGRKLRRFGVCWFLFGFLPVSNLFVTINAVVAEHWLYLPSIGLLLFAAGCAVELRTARLRMTALVAVMVAATACGVRTYWRAFDWTDEMTFFSQTVEAGGDLPRARMGMANAYSHSNKDTVAIGMLRRIAAENPAHAGTEINLGNALLRQGLREEGRQVLEHAFMRCRDQEPHEVLVVIASLDRLETKPGWSEMRKKALLDLRRRYPDSWEVVDLDVRDASDTGNPGAALEEVARYARDRWWHYPSHVMLGLILSEIGRKDNAVRVLVEASKLDVHDADALSLAATIDSGAGRLVEAETLQGRALSRQPGSPKQHLIMGSILAALGQSQQAAQQAEIATALLRQASGTAIP